MYVIGVDPGPLPGVVRLRLLRDPTAVVSSRLIGAEALQVTPGALTAVLDALGDGVLQVMAVERFVVGRRAGRSATAEAGTRTRSMVGVVEAWAGIHCFRTHGRSAAEVKPWAADARLEAAGLLEL